MNDSCPYHVVRTLTTPAPISALQFGHAGHVYAGSGDGTLRVYDLSSYKVLKAVRGLKNEVSSIACLKRPGSETRDAWVACGHQIFLFKMDMISMIATVEDAITTVQVTETDDELNEITLDPSKKHLAFSTDLGVVGVVDLTVAIPTVMKMKEKHTSICACVKFVPDRPREIVSTGYDETFLHFDFVEGDPLTQHKLDFTSNTEGVSLSPPFIMSTAFSTTGILAAGIADGSLWVGFGGQKGSSKMKTKKSRKWNGLSPEGKQVCDKVAEGPIVAMTFLSPDTLVASTLLGLVIQWKIKIDSVNQEDIVKEIWRKQAVALDKVNALVAIDTKIAIGGLSKDGKGVFEVWDRRGTPEVST
ncbi:WD40-repeat-containing domain protein [Lentinula raphanica]|uniref:WD40-repeat-containing domain protein n=1 Tax=Lentinula raphanica TaxID=153919 RepID=A0AA38UFQ3_9AGAR|nr:WD40-repeat-containing domain protein [Lentinula raphanica]KAJ3826624.1 WD40-repeat-containing domain protein [Lentinula raphanica]KAJ3839849.1 WD40-repeat-containing domain protein [Lentinula raphanica]KAJ3972689.1 WD40-repeat-containing domain protein [Lentinula raphanica]